MYCIRSRVPLYHVRSAMLAIMSIRAVLSITGTRQACASEWALHGVRASKPFAFEPPSPTAAVGGSPSGSGQSG